MNEHEPFPGISSRGCRATEQRQRLQQITSIRTDLWNIQAALSMTFERLSGDLNAKEFVARNFQYAWKAFYSVYSGPLADLRGRSLDCLDVTLVCALADFIEEAEQLSQHWLETRIKQFAERLLAFQSKIRITEARLENALTECLLSLNSPCPRL